MHDHYDFEKNGWEGGSILDNIEDSTKTGDQMKTRFLKSFLDSGEGHFLIIFVYLKESRNFC